MTELEDQIRAALHSGEISPDQLRYPTLRGDQPTAPRGRRMLAVAAVACVVVALAALTLVLRSPHEATPAGGDALAGVIGWRWKVTAVAEPSGRTSVPSSSTAEVDFTPDGHVGGDDTVNGLYGRYHRIAGGYRVTDASSTLVGGTGPAPLVTTAIDHLFVEIAPSAGQRPAPVLVRVTLHGRVLTLQRSPYTLTLRRAGPQPTEPSATPTPTR